MARKEIHINIAPLVDVMLVLLIIFMVTAPMVQAGVNLNLPTTGRSSYTNSKPIVISVTAHGTIYVNEKRVPFHELGNSLRKIARPEDVIQLKADKRLQYEKIFDVINRLVDEGFAKVSLMAEMK